MDAVDDVVDTVFGTAIFQVFRVTSLLVQLGYLLEQLVGFVLELLMLRTVRTTDRFVFLRFSSHAQRNREYEICE
jgi:uncharacterized membrane protein